MPNVDDIYKKNQDGWVSRFILDEVVIMPLCKSEEDMQYIYAISNETGSRIWQMLDGKNSVKEIQEALKKEFQAKSEAIEEGVVTFIRDLLSVKLLERSGKTKAVKREVSNKNREGRSLDKKKPYKEPEITKVKMQPEQAVLSCCIYSRYGKYCGGGFTGNNWCDRGTTCGPTDCIVMNWLAGWSTSDS
jgi:hypothetical protein